MSFAYLHIILAFWLSSQSAGLAYKKVDENKQSIELRANNSHSYLLDFSDIFYNTNSKESFFGLTESIISSVSRILFRDYHAKKNLELTIKVHVSNYILVAENRVIGFKCSDIIFPFNYFW